MPLGTGFILREAPMKMIRISADEISTKSDVLLIANGVSLKTMSFQRKSSSIGGNSKTPNTAGALLLVLDGVADTGLQAGCGERETDVPGLPPQQCDVGDRDGEHEHWNVDERHRLEREHDADDDGEAADEATEDRGVDRTGTLLRPPRDDGGRGKEVHRDDDQGEGRAERAVDAADQRGCADHDGGDDQRVPSQVPGDLT